MSNRNFDNSFKDAFENFEVQPKGDIWAGVKKELDEGNSKRKRFFWLFFSGTSAIVIIGLLTSLLFIEKSKNKISTFAQATPVQKISALTSAAVIQEVPGLTGILKNKVKSHSTPTSTVIQDEKTSISEQFAQNNEPEKENASDAKQNVVPAENSEQPVQASTPGELTAAVIFSNSTATIAIPLITVKNPAISTQNDSLKIVFPQPVYPAKTDQEKKHWTIGLLFSPEYLNPKFSSSNEFYQTQAAVFNSSKSPMFSYSNGFSVGYAFNSHFSISSGLLYERLAVRSNSVLITEDSSATSKNTLSTYSLSNSSTNSSLPSPPNGTFGPAIVANTNVSSLYLQTTPSNLKVYQVNYESQLVMEYIKIPLLAQYRYQWKKIGFAFELGLENNILLNSTTKVYVHHGGYEQNLYETNDSGTLKKYYCSAYSSFTLYYYLGQDYYLSAGPSFSYSLGSISNNTIKDQAAIPGFQLELFRSF